MLVLKQADVAWLPAVDAGAYAANMLPILAPKSYLGLPESATCAPEAELLAALAAMGVAPASAASSSSAPPPPPEDEAAFDAYLSYSWASKSLVDATAARLTSLGVRCWLDTEQIQSGVDVLARVARGVFSSRVVIVFLSPAYLNNSHCNKELSMAEGWRKQVLVIKQADVAWLPAVDAGAYAASMLPILAPKSYLGLPESATCAPEAELLAALAAMGVAPARAASSSSAPPP